MQKKMQFPSTCAVGEARMTALGCRGGNLNIKLSRLEGGDSTIDMLGKTAVVFNHKWKLFFSVLVPSSLAALDIVKLIGTR